jgi:pentose-5-phosphate-3-epimerase
VNEELIRAADELGLTLSGSLIAVEKQERPKTAQNLWARGCWVHADVIDGSYGTRPSVSPDEIRELVHGPGAVDVHLMVDDVGGWIERLPAGLERLTIQVDRHERVDEVMELARRKANSVWIAFDPGEIPSWFIPDQRAGVDGVLVLLTPPGRDGHVLDERRIADVVRLNGILPTGVDGGVKIAHLRAIADAGATYVVAGRGLLNGRPVHEPTSHATETSNAIDV